MAKVQANIKGLKLQGFKNFIVELGVPGLAMGTIVGQQITAIVQAFSAAVIIPVLQAVRATAGGGVFSLPAFNFQDMISSIFSFGVTMGTLYIIIQAFDLTVRRPVQFVRVVNYGDFPAAMTANAPAAAATVTPTPAATTTPAGPGS